MDSPGHQALLEISLDLLDNQANLVELEQQALKVKEDP
jgi:hypothetical protein